MKTRKFMIKTGIILSSSLLLSSIILNPTVYAYETNRVIRVRNNRLASFEADKQNVLETIIADVDETLPAPIVGSEYQTRGPGGYFQF